MTRTIRKFLLEINAVRKCEGGYSCSLVANGRKVLFMAPEIFEWTAGHSTRNDILEFYADKHGIGKSQPVALEEGWMAKEPEYKSDVQDKAEAHIKKWMEKYITRYNEAKAIKERCRNTVITKLRDVRPGILDHCFSPVILGSQVAMSQFKKKFVPGEVLLNGLTIDEIIELL